MMLQLYNISSKGQGNTSPAAEFNFRVDPEAAYVVLNEITSSTTIVPLETCSADGIPWVTTFYMATKHDHARPRRSPSEYLVIGLFFFLSVAMSVHYSVTHIKCNL